LEIQIAEGQNLEKALRQFRRKVQRAGILKRRKAKAAERRRIRSARRREQRS